MNKKNAFIAAAQLPKNMGLEMGNNVINVLRVANYLQEGNA